MHALQIDHIVQQRIMERQAAAARHRLIAIARRARRLRHEGHDAADRIGVLAHDLATLGPRAIELELARYARDARAVGAAPLPLALLADTTLPDVVRQRAFAHVVASIKRSGHTARVVAA
jgi:hypothetical protein